MARVREWEGQLIAWHRSKLTISVHVYSIFAIKADVFDHIVFRIHAQPAGFPNAKSPRIIPCVDFATIIRAKDLAPAPAFESRAKIKMRKVLGEVARF